MTIETDIVNWARTRPAWQRAVLRRVARGDNLDDEDYRGIVDKLCEADWKGREAFEASDFPAVLPSAGQVGILAIKDIDKVNALVKGQELRFAREGLTLVFGENGSGKSGYARVIKAMVRTRHREDILTDIFSDSGTGTGTAVITLQTDGDALDVSWPEGERSELNQISFYDEACGDAYLTREAETTYRPHALFVMDGLIRACDGVREELDRRIAGNRSQAVAFPKLDERTSAAQLIEKLSSRTTKNDIETACNLPDDVAAQIERFKQEEARLAATNPAKEKARLQAAARHFDKLAEHAAELTESFGDEATACLREAHAALRTARAASTLASEESFEDEPIGGVGTPAWRSLWEAARHFAVERVLDFPPASADARCVLCHQELDEEASDRLKRFDAFVKNETQQNAATKTWKNAVRRIETLGTTPAQVLSALDTLGEEHSDLIERYRSAMHACVERRDELLKQDAGEPWSEPATLLLKVPATDPAERANKLRAKADGIDDESFAKEIELAASERRELEAKVALAKYRKPLVAEVQRLRELEKLEQLKGQADTRGVSRKAAEITRAHVTTVMRDRFTRETERLRLEHVSAAATSRFVLSSSQRSDRSSCLPTTFPSSPTS